MPSSFLLLLALAVQRTTIEQVGDPATAPAIAQISPARGGGIAPDQLSDTRRQASRAGARSEASAPSTPRDGRTVATVPVGGRDACDPANPATAAVCARPIETRAAQFASPTPAQLSAEQRLLVDQRLRDVPGTIDAVTRSAADRPVDARAAEVQGVASVVLPGSAVQPAAPPAPGETLAPEAAALIQVLLQQGAAPR